MRTTLILRIQTQPHLAGKAALQRIPAGALILWGAQLCCSAIKRTGKFSSGGHNFVRQFRV